MRYKIAFNLFLTLCFSSQAYSAPQIEFAPSVLNEGVEARITGNGFGSHNLDVDWLGGDSGIIENGSTGQTLRNSGSWDFNNGGRLNPIIDQTYSHSGTKSLYCDQNTNGTYSCMIRRGHPTPIGANQTIFASWWVRRSHSGSGQWKMFRLNWQNDAKDDHAQFVMFNWDDSNQFFVRPGPDVHTNATKDWSPPYPSSDNRWYRIDLEVHTSSIGQSNGTYTMRLHDPQGGSPVTQKLLLDGSMSFDDSNRLYQWFIWQNYIGNGVVSQRTWMDDFYVQVGTSARVELGDKPTWNKCTFTEIQPPTAWMNNELTIVANQGSFHDGDTAYLFVIDAAGNPSTSYPVTIGGGGGGPVPYCGDGNVDAGEECDDGNTVDGDGCSASCTVEAAPYCGDGNIDAGEECDDGNNVDADGCSAACLVEVAPPPAVDNDWDATVQLNNTNWLNSSVTYCVRLLVEGEKSITDSGSLVQLGFRGRTSENYTIRKVSIAERDTAGAEGDVVDSTWTRVTFDGQTEATWGTNAVSVNANQEKFSNEISFDLQAGTDYYVTFKIDTPSVYLTPPASYRELYFSNADHTDDIDWSGNGHSQTQDYHAFSSIVVSGAALSQPEIVDITIQQ